MKRLGKQTASILVMTLALMLTVGCGEDKPTPPPAAAGAEFTFYGGPSADIGFSVAEMPDRGFVICGFTTAEDGLTRDLYVVRTDESGDTIWTGTYGGDGDEIAYSVVSTSEGGCVIAGETNSEGAGGYDVYLLKLDASGDTVFTRTFGGAADDHAYSISDRVGGYIIAGKTESFGTGSTDVYVLWVDADGELAMSRTYGGTGAELAKSIVPLTETGGFLAVGTSSSFGDEAGDIYVLKLGEFGDTVWTRTFGGNKTDAGMSADVTTQGNYLIGGYTYSYGEGASDAYVLELTPEGEVFDSLVVGKQGSDFCSSAIVTSDGGIVLAGWSSSWDGTFRVYVVTICDDYNLGDWRWTHMLYLGESDRQIGRALVEASDGSYVIVGESKHDGDQLDIFLVKVGPYPCGG